MTRFSVAVLVVLCSATAAVHATEAGYPVKPIRLVVPFVAGASFDTIARLVAQPLSDKWHQQVVIDNRPGASGIIGADIVARADANGYTLGLFGGNQTLSQAVRTKLPYDMLRDFSPITRVATLDNVLVVNPSLHVNTLTEFISLLKAHPGKYYFGSGGTGGDTHFSGSLFNIMAGVNTVHVPYKGGGLAVTGLLANEVQFMVVNVISAAPQVRAGRLKALAVAAKERSTALPDVPTSAEAGLPGLLWSQWYGFFAPAKVDRGLIAKLNKAIGEVAQSGEFVAKMQQQGARPMHETPQALAVFVKETITNSRKIAREAHISVE